MNYLITGATGNIGGLVAQRLIERGERPIVLARDPAKARARFSEHAEIRTGDLADGQSLLAVLTGVDAVFAVSSGRDIAAQDESLASAAKAQRVRRIVKLSTIDAAREGEAGVGAWHARGEAAIRASNLAFTFVRSGGFMSNALAWARSIKADGTVRASTGDGKVALIHPADLAEVALHVLTSGEYEGQVLSLTGPEALSYAEMTRAIGETIGKELTFCPISDAEARERMAATGAPAAVTEALVSLWRAVREGRVATVTDTVARVLGRKALTFQQWAEQNARAFS